MDAGTAAMVVTIGPILIALLGVALCVVAAVCYAAGVVFRKPALGHASAIQVTTFGCFTGTAACLPFAGQLVSQLGVAVSRGRKRSPAPVQVPDSVGSAAG